jgi:hypothetical protein
MVFDEPSFEFGTLIIDGTLKFDPSIEEITIRARNIWVRGGRFIAGTAEYPFPGKINIILYGTRMGKPLYIDDISRTGTKTMSVTGTVEFYAKHP